MGIIVGVLGGNTEGAGIDADRQLSNFQKNNPPLFKGTYDPKGAQKWLKEIERIFRVIVCAENLNVRYNTYMLSEEADDWWVASRDELEAAGVAITWEVFRREFSRRIYEEDNLKMKSSHPRELVYKKGKKPMDKGKPYGKGNPRAGGWKKPSGGDSGALVRCYRCGEPGHRVHECKSKEKRCFKCGKAGHLVGDCKGKVVT
ncbi:uncharacterized protein LOC131604876 [Vicia villosa]|uniref:uncharacterized protein LOC131604876 n=1 Tax=Vicia villosa TaxID=3911 RepID=UPI00273BB0CE|nr:uncharacterized protein LOC131604876 [Vicia villosa]